jgi:microcystin-dependent protein
MALYLGSNEVSQKVLLLSGNKSDIEVGDLCYSLRTEKEGWLLCDGTSYSTTDYPDLFAVIGYTFGGSENNFNVPNYKGKFLQMINDSQTLGQNIEAGLPNITGHFGNFSMQDSAATPLSSGAFYNVNSDGKGGHGTLQDVANFDGYSFNASRSSSIYGKSNTVQPPASIVNYFIKY